MKRPRDIFQAIWSIMDPSLIPLQTLLHAKVCNKCCALSFGTYENERALQSCPEMTEAWCRFVDSFVLLPSSGCCLTAYLFSYCGRIEIFQTYIYTHLNLFTIHLCIPPSVTVFFIAFSHPGVVFISVVQSGAMRSATVSMRTSTSKSSPS